jgi:hypothetical protein
MNCERPRMRPPFERRDRRTLTLRIGAAVGAAAVLAAGCATGPGRANGIDALHVFSVPVALDLDGLPGPDGFGLTLYASAATVAKGIPITTGRTEILMFDGALESDAKTNAAPRRVWSFTPADLKSYAIKTSLGTGYRLTPRWGDTPPLGNRITIVARFVPSRQTSVQSAPTTITVIAK